MIKTIVTAAALVLPIGFAQAQGVGAMGAVTYGVATSSQDVELQQQGRTTAAQGARALEGRSAAEAWGYAPGTVGAAPGSTVGR